MKIYDIVRELPNRKAIIHGEYRDLHVGDEVVIRDHKGICYDAVVVIRGGYGVFLVEANEVI